LPKPSRRLSASEARRSGIDVSGRAGFAARGGGAGASLDQDAPPSGIGGSDIAAPSAAAAGSFAHGGRYD
jgi:hypothetical protein